MTLLHITTVPQTFGFILGQILYMRQNGWKVHTISSPGPYEAALRDHGLPFHDVPMERRITPFWDLWAIARLWWTIRQIRPTLVHAHTPKAGLLGMIAAKFAGVPLRIFQVHGLPHLAARGYRRWLLVLATRVACRLADRVFCVGKSIRQVLIHQNLCASDKCYVPMHGSSAGVDAANVYNPARFDSSASATIRESYGIPGDAFVLAFAGRLVRDKGLIELCEAWKVLRHRPENLHLLIAGDIEPQDPVPSVVLEAFRADSRVHLIGRCSQMPEFYAASDLVVLPSYREGFGNVLLEANAMTLPVVATRIPGCVDSVADGVTGTLVPPHDAAAVAQAVERYMDDPELRRLHGVRGRERALSDFRVEPIWEFIALAYEELLNQQGLNPPKTAKLCTE